MLPAVVKIAIKNPSLENVLGFLNAIQALNKNEWVGLLLSHSFKVVTNSMIIQHTKAEAGLLMQLERAPSAQVLNNIPGQTPLCQ